jgi:hypothetical protein
MGQNKFLFPLDLVQRFPVKVQCADDLRIELLQESYT